MQDEIRNSLITLTTIITVLGVYIKVVDSFIINTIKSEYKNIPIKQSVFNIMITFAGYILVSLYFIFIIKGVIHIYKNGFLESFSLNVNLEKPNLGTALGLILAIAFLSTLTVVMINVGKTRSAFINKLENKSYEKIKRYTRGINYYGIISAIVVNLYCIIYLYLVILTNIKFVNSSGIYIVENYINDEELSSIAFSASMLFISFTSFLLLNSFREIHNAVNESKMYILFTNKETIVARCFLEYDEYYLIFEDGIERYIKKSEVKEIRKEEFS